MANNLTIADKHLAAVLAGREPLLFDGAMGTQLQAAGLAVGELPELLCLEQPDLVTKVHRAYVEAGSEVVSTNTFGANAHKLGAAASVREVFDAAVACARKAGARYVAADIGPTGSLLRPLGTLSFDEAYDLFAEEARAAETAGADLFIVETMADLLEAKAAVLACRENTNLPIFCTMTFGEDGRTFLGTTPEVAAVTLASLGVDAVGINCSLGPDEVAPLVMRMLPWVECPVMVQANAGLPCVVDGVTTYPIGPEEYVQSLRPLAEAGIRIMGGCCGTTPDHIRVLRALLDDTSIASSAGADGDKSAGPSTLSPTSASAPASLPLASSPLASHRDDFRVTSARELFSLASGEVGVIGERINPTGKRKLKEALRSGNYDYVLGEAVAQERAGAEVLDVNAGLPEIDEPATMVQLIERLQSVTSLPLQIDSADPTAIEQAVRIYPGKPIVNSVNGKQENLDAVLPIVAHYGCAVVGLTLDEQGIPATAEGRLKVAEKIVAACDTAGIPRRDVLIDCLTMAVSTDQGAAGVILDAIRLVKKHIPGVRCVLGVSNVSFGLPFRELINATFLSAAFAAGLDLAIMNPLSQRFMDTVAAWRVLNGQDAGATRYIAANAGRSDKAGASASVPGASTSGAPVTGASSTDASSATGGAAAVGARLDAGKNAESLSASERAHMAVVEGRGDPCAQAVSELLSSHEALWVINEILIPALDEVGDKFEKGTLFLPQLMASAEAAKAGFEVVRSSVSSADVPDKGEVAICTVKGDIHDIGKNIVRMLLENYGYRVRDLGRDVDPQAFVDEVVAHHIKLAGLSALMTTTVPAMAETIALLREQAPWCKVVVGGAVLNPEYAQMVGADYYAKDAAETARIAGEVFGERA